MWGGGGGGRARARAVCVYFRLLDQFMYKFMISLQSMYCLPILNVRTASNQIFSCAKHKQIF